MIHSRRPERSVRASLQREESPAFTRQGGTRRAFPPLLFFLLACVTRGALKSIVASPREDCGDVEESDWSNEGGRGLDEIDGQQNAPPTDGLTMRAHATTTRASFFCVRARFHSSKLRLRQQCAPTSILERLSDPAPGRVGLTDASALQERLDPSSLPLMTLPFRRAVVTYRYFGYLSFLHSLASVR